MNDRIAELLSEAADDAGAPLGFTSHDLLRRGRARVRRRRALAGGGLAASVAVVAVGLSLVGGSGEHSEAPTGPSGPSQAVDSASPGPTDTSSDTPSPTATPPSATELRLTRQCDAAGTGRAPHLVDEGWSLDAQVSDRLGSTATFVSPDGAQWSTCLLSPGGDSLGPAVPLDDGPVPASWRDPANAYKRDSEVDFGPGCLDAKDHPCSTRVYYEGLPLREGVADVDVLTPSGRHVSAVLGTYTYIVRFIDPEPADGSSVPPIVATLRDAAGHTIIRYDYNEALR